MQKKILITISIICSFLLVSLLLALPIFTIKNVGINLTVNEQVFVIMGFVFLIIIAIAISYFINLTIILNQLVREWKILVLLIIVCNFGAIIYWTKFGTKQIKFQRKRGFRNLDLTIMGFSLALFLLLASIEAMIPYLPFYISISIKYVPLFFLAYLARFWQTFLVCLIAGLFMWLMPNNADIGNIWAFLFDYFLPIVGVSLASLLAPNETKNKQLSYFAWLIFIFIPYFVGYLSKVMAGVLFWFATAWDDYDKWSYSFIFNAINSIFDLMFGIILVIPICQTLKFLKTRYY